MVRGPSRTDDVIEERAGNMIGSVNEEINDKSTVCVTLSCCTSFVRAVGDYKVFIISFGFCVHFHTDSAPG